MTTSLRPSSSPVRVAIVRQQLGWEDWLARVLVGAAGTFFIGWLVMLIAGAVSPWNPSYWHAVLALIGLRLVQVGSGWAIWTHPFDKKRDRR